MKEFGGSKCRFDVADPSDRFLYSMEKEMGLRSWDPSSLLPITARHAPKDFLQGHAPKNGLRGLSSWTRGGTGGSEPSIVNSREEESDTNRGNSNPIETGEGEAYVQKEVWGGGSLEPMLSKAENGNLGDVAGKNGGDVMAGLSGREEQGATESDSTKKDSSDRPVGRSKRHDLAILYTCTVCDTRSGQTMSRATYNTGVVIIRCPKCKNLHLIADRLGWFGEPGSVEDFLSAQGVSVKRGTEKSYEFTPEDLRGWTRTEV